MKKKNEREKIMISYAPFWETLKNSSETTYSLIKKHNINSTTISRLKHNRSVTLSTIDDLCKILDCDITDIVEII